MFVNEPHFAWLWYAALEPLGTYRVADVHVLLSNAQDMPVPTSGGVEPLHITLVIPVHSLNAPTPMTVAFSEMVTDFIELHF